jgi:hypothetical protein
LKKIFVMVLILALLTGGCAGKTTVLSEENAIQQVLKEHPDFPAKSGDVKTIRVPTGGEYGAAAMVDYKTNAEKTPDGKYQITLTKDWHLVVNGQTVFSYWKYMVGPDGAVLAESDDRDSLPNIMK